MQILRMAPFLFFFFWLYSSALTITQKDHEDFENQWTAAQQSHIRPTPVFTQKREGARKIWLSCNPQNPPIEIFAAQSTLTFIPGKVGPIFLEEMEKVECTTQNETHKLHAHANHASFDYVQRELKGAHISVEERTLDGEIYSKGKALAAHMILREATPKFHARKFSLETMRENISS